MPQSDQSKVYVVDDDQPVCESLMSMVRCLGHDVASFSSAREFLATADASRPGCVVTDLHMPGMNGIELQEVLTSRDLQWPVIILTGHCDVPTAVRAMKAGAVDFLEKPCSPDVLSTAIRGAVELAQARFANWRERGDFHQTVETLTAEERLILAAMVRGKSNREIAAVLDVSQRTVQFRRSALFRKFGVTTRAELIDRALKASWDPQSEPLPGGPPNRPR